MAAPSSAGWKRAVGRLLPGRVERGIAWSLDSGGQRERWSRDRFFRQAARHSLLIGCETGYGELILSTADVGVTRRLFIHRAYADVEQMDLVARILTSLGRSPAEGSVFCEVGAHIGSTTIYALRRHGFGAALAFEPAPDNYRLLRTNLALNGLEERVGTRNCAVSNREGELELWLSPNRHGAHRIGAGEPGADRVPVAAVSLDGLVARGELDPSSVGMLWVDVEGHEAEVLAGATTLLGREIPVVIEYQPRHLSAGGRLEEIEDLIAGSFSQAFDLMGPYDLNRSGALPRAVPASEIGSISEAYRERKETDLLLV